MFTMLLAFAACVKEEPVSVSFNSDTYQMTVGDTLNLAGELVVVNYDKRPLLSVDVDSIVDVKADGRVVALAEGEAVITATADGVSASCTVVVSDIRLEKVTVTAPGSVLVGEVGAVVKAAVEPKGYSPSGLDWKFSAVPENLQFEYAELRPGEYNVKVKEFVKDAKVTVIVSGKKETAVADTAVMAVVREVVLADRILLDMPARLTGGVDGVWAPVSVKVEPAEYDLANLVWNFTATAGLDFKTEEVTPGEYKVSFSNYVEGGKLSVEVRDANSETFNKGDINVLEKPVEGAATLFFKSKAMTLCLGDEPWTPELICEPGGYDPYLLEWSMSDKGVAALEDGKVTPLKAGETELTVKDMVSGKKAVCKIEVIEAVEKADIVSINVVPSNLQLKMNEDIVQLTTICKDASGKTIGNYTGLEWMAATVEDSFGQQIAIVEVSDRGVVTPKYVGTTYVTVRDKYNTHVEAVCHVNVTAAEIKVEKVNLSHTEMLLAKGYSIALEASVLPVNADDKTIRFKSSNEAVVSVAEDGLVTGNAIGEADVYAIAANGAMSKCHVKVVDKALYLDLNEAVMAKGAVRKLVLSRVPEDRFSGNVSWTSSNPDVVTVSDGTMTAVGEGNAKVTASIGEFAAECAVEVVGSGFLDGLSFDYSDPSVEFSGLQQDMTVRLVPVYEHNGSGAYIPAKVSWSSSHPDIATVDEHGNVTAVVEEIKKSGMDNGHKVTLTHNADGMRGSVEITVVKAMPQEIRLLSVPSVGDRQYTMMHGQTFVFETEVLPEKASQVVNIQTSATGVGFLEGGRFYAANPGNVTCTAYADDDTGVRLSFNIEVLPVPVESFTIIGESRLELWVGDEMFLKTEIIPTNASYTSISWSSNRESVVKVGHNGKIEAVGPGEAVISGVLQGGESVEYKVVVTEPARLAAVGDFYYSDGTTSKGYDRSKTVVGVVFSTKNITLQDPGLPTDCKNGLVVSLQEVPTAWQAAGADVAAWASDNMQYYDLTNQELACGYSNTLALKAYNEANPDKKVLAVEHMPADELPAATSGWYLPSFEELRQMAAAYETIKGKIEEAGGVAINDTEPGFGVIGDGGSNDTYRYWSSTESSTSWSWGCAYQFYDGGSGFDNMVKTKSHYLVRYIFAF